MPPLRKRNVVWIGVESHILYIPKGFEGLRWAAPYIDHFITRFGSHMGLNNPPPKRIPPDDTLKQIVENGQL